jgi:hypothetical protein
MSGNHQNSQKTGRYAHAGGLASIDLPREGKRCGGKIEIVHGIAPDPYFANEGQRRGRGKHEVLGQRQQRVAINRRADAIEFELSCGRISQAAADAARAYQRVVESARKATGALNWEQGSGGGDHDAAIASRLDRAWTLVAWSDSIGRIAGGPAARMIDLAVDERLSIADIALRFGYASRWGRARIGDAFRVGLERIAVEWERTGFPTS